MAFSLALLMYTFNKVVLNLEQCKQGTHNAQKMKFSIKDFSSKYDQIFCAVSIALWSL